MTIFRVGWGAWLGLGSVLLTQAALAQRQPVPPLAPLGVAVAAPFEVGQPVIRRCSLSIRIVCRPTSPAQPVLLLLNSRILVGQQALRQLNPQDIADLRIYKSAAELPGWPPFTAAVSGLIDIKLKKGVRIRSKPLEALKHQLHLAGPVRYEQYGQPLPAARLRIARADANELTLRGSTSGDTVIVLSENSWLPKSELVPASPGRIMIRGAASQ